MHGAFPLHLAERSSRGVEEEEQQQEQGRQEGKEEEEEEVQEDEDDGDGDGDGEDEDDDTATAHGSNAAISSLFTNFGHECQPCQKRPNRR